MLKRLNFSATFIAKSQSWSIGGANKVSLSATESPKYSSRN